MHRKPCTLALDHKLCPCMTPMLLSAVPAPAAGWAPCWTLPETRTDTSCPAVCWRVKLAAPVHKLVAAGQQCLWLDGISCIVPLLLYSASMQDCNVVANAWLPASTDGAPPATRCPVFDCRLPGMGMPTLSQSAEPPHLASRSTCDFHRGERPIAGGMPLAGNVRTPHSQSWLACSSCLVSCPGRSPAGMLNV